MPYKEPVKVKKGWVLPKKEGGYHSINGKIIHFKSKEAAKAAGQYIMIKENNPGSMGRKR